MDSKTLHRRLGALALGVAVAAAVVAGTFVALPSQEARDAHTDYGYVYSGAKSSSVGFVRANLRDNTLLVLGSSEFSTPARLVPQVPAAIMGTHNYGVRLMLVGEAFDQCLWDTIALGAMAKDALPNNRVAVIVGLGQFTDGGLDNATFQTRFSRSLYRAFSANGHIPASLRDRVRERLAQQGVDETTLRSASPADPIDTVDATVFDAMDDLKLRNQLNEVRASGIPLAEGAVETPDWDTLREEALLDAERMSTTNEWGVEDEFYTSQLAPALNSLAGTRAGETYANTPEYGDLDLFLSVCEACGISPMVVIQPSLGPYYDHIGISQQTRADAYERIRDVVASHPTASLADFSDREYERYFMFDIVHFGWTGWIEAQKALYDFATEGA